MQWLTFSPLSLQIIFFRFYPSCHEYASFSSSQMPLLSGWSFLSLVSLLSARHCAFLSPALGEWLWFVSPIIELPDLFSSRRVCWTHMLFLLFWDSSEPTGEGSNALIAIPCQNSGKCSKDTQVIFMDISEITKILWYLTILIGYSVALNFY